MYNQRPNNRYRSSSHSQRPTSGNRSNGSGGGGNYGYRRGGQRSSGSRNSIDVTRYINRIPEEVIEQAYIPTVNINELNIHERIKSNIAKKGFTNLTPIQDKSIPLILDGRDIIGIANTGTGKTAAFLIPLINKVCQNKTEKVLIMAPTRELAQQINVEFKSLAQDLNLYSTLCIGGTSMGLQKRELNYIHNFLICTPGRIKDLAQRNWVRLSEYSNIIIDEFDRMFDMGFKEDIQIILEMLPKKRQSLFFSATISPDIESIFNKYLTAPERISINQRISSVNIMQDVIRTIPGTNKVDQLHDLLIKEEFKKVLVFIKTKWNLKSLEKELIDRGFSVESIHGNKTQSARQKSLANFKSNRMKILLATDVAARGLDIDNITHVINYDQPATYDDYLHRIGRTGRGSKKGVALTFV